MSVYQFTRNRVCRNVLEKLRTRFGLKPISSTFTLEACTWRFGKCASPPEPWNSTKNVAKRDFTLKSQYLESYTDEDLAMASAYLDGTVEEQFGYRLRGSNIIQLSLAKKGRNS